MRRPIVTTIVVVLVSSTSVARAEEKERRPPLAEPIFTESTTDIDGDEPGEIEFDVNAFEASARRGGARLYQTSVEAEWKVWSRLGVRIEPSLASGREQYGAAIENKFGLRVAAGWSLLHDFEDDFHVQIEASGRLVDDASAAFSTQPGEAVAPFNADLKAAIRVWSWTIRGSVGAEAGATSAHAPLRAQLAVMRPFTDDIRFGFYGLEADVDFARQNPVILAPNVWADVTSVGLPMRVGLGVPITLGASDVTPAVGVYLRLLILTSREASFERREAAHGASVR